MKRQASGLAATGMTQRGDRAGPAGAIELQGERVVLRAIGAGDAPALRRIRATPEVATWWHETEDDWPLSEEPATTRLTIVIAGQVAGMIQFSEEQDPEYRHAGIDVFLDPSHHGQGLGTEALATLARHLIEQLGHHRLTIDPAAENAVAIRCYEKVGFRRVGVMRAYWRDHATGE